MIFATPFDASHFLQGRIQQSVPVERARVGQFKGMRPRRIEASAIRGQQSRIIELEAE
jgi:hypothetical protein